MKKKILPDIISIFIIILCIGTFFFSLFYPSSHIIVTPDFGRSDAWNLSYSMKHIFSVSLKSSQTPFWNQYMGLGFPTLGEGESGIFYPISVILSLLFSAQTAYNFTILFSVLFFCIGMYVFLRYILIHPVAALSGSLSITFSGIVIPHLTHIALLQSASWLPWILIATFLLIKKRSYIHVCFLSIVISYQILSGFPQFVFITLIFSGLFIMWHIKNTKAYTILIPFCTSVILSFLLTAIVLIPSSEFLKQTTVPNGFSPSQSMYFSYPIKHFITMVHPFLLGNPQNGTYPSFSQFDGSIFWENSGFIGIITLIFIIFSLKLKDRKTRNIIQFFIITSIVSMFLMTGKFSPFYILYSFPPFTFFRVPSRFIWIFSTSLVILSSFGITYILSNTSKIIRFGMYAVLIGNIMYSFILWQQYNMIGKSLEWLKAPPIGDYLNSNDVVYTIGDSTRHNETFLTHGWKDEKPYFDNRNLLSPNSNALWNVSHLSSYAGRQLLRPSLVDSLLEKTITNNSEEATMSAEGVKILQTFGVTKILSSVPVTSVLIQPITEVSTISAHIYAYSIEDSIREYVAQNIIIASTLKKASQALVHPSFIPGHDAIVEKQLIQIPADAKGSIHKQYSSNSVSIYSVTISRGPALIVINQTYYPGWNVYIDNEKNNVLPVNIRSIGCIVDNGNHTVEFRYEPDSLRIGLIVSTAGISIMGILLALHFHLFVFRKKQTIQ